MEDLKNRLANLKAIERTRIKDMQSLEKKIKAFEEFLANPPETENVETVQEERVSSIFMPMLITIDMSAETPQRGTEQAQTSTK